MKQKMEADSAAREEAIAAARAGEERAMAELSATVAKLDQTNEKLRLSNVRIEDLQKIIVALVIFSSHPFFYLF